jgi:hypothetical protein
MVLKDCLGEELKVGDTVGMIEYWNSSIVLMEVYRIVPIPVYGGAKDKNGEYVWGPTGDYHSIRVLMRCPESPNSTPSHASSDEVGKVKRIIKHKSKERNGNT